MNPNTLSRRLMAFACLLTLAVILLGAWTRLSDAGLGCPDWPGCYGHFTVPTKADDIAQGNALYPAQPLVAEKAWPEMIHRHFAKAIGLTILIFAVIAWRKRGAQGHPRKQAYLMLAWVVFQGLLGMWTVTLKLHPAVVMAHLLGGFMTFALCFLAWLRLSGRPALAAPARLRRVAAAALLVLVAQIALGGWTSANYAAVVCGDSLPVCQEGWSQRLDFAEGFQPHHEGKASYEFGVKSLEGRTAIHVSHRFGALLTAGLLSLLAVLLWREPRHRALAVVLGGLLLVQLGLGLANIHFLLPLPVAVAHNGGAALLLLALVAANYRLRRA
ncbi:MAG: COX15/CtaA family protein [Gammaproteobacteria bacterium]|nr:COX15/CtaA family protein [Gammaproteobacteria bacterium]